MRRISFRRITTSGLLIPEIDGLRFIAIFSVLVFHAFTEFSLRTYNGMHLPAVGYQASMLPAELRSHSILFRFLAHGAYGVPIFFAISGFVLAWPFARQHLHGGKPVGLGPYFLRRLTRLEPPYLLSLFIRAALIYLSGQRAVHALLMHLLASALYVHNIAYHDASTINAVAWSLEIEVQFYCIAPLITQIYRLSNRYLRRGILLAAIVACTPLQNLLLPGWNDWSMPGALKLSLLAYIQFFLVGLLLADLYVDGWDRIPRTWLWDLIAIPLWIWLFWMELYSFRYLAAIILTITFLGAFKGHLVRAILRSPFISIVGGMCYSIYLVHRTVIVAVMSVLLRFHFHGLAAMFFVMTLMIVPAVAVSAVYFLLIERPCMDRNWPQELMVWLGLAKAAPPSPDAKLPRTTETRYVPER